MYPGRALDCNGVLSFPRMSPNGALLRPLAQLQRYVRSWMNSGSCWTVLKRRTFGIEPRIDIYARRKVFNFLWRTSIGSNVRRAGSSSPPRRYCHFALQHGPTPNSARSFFASSESHLAGFGARAISSALAEPQTGALAQLSFYYFAFLAL